MIGGGVCSLCGSSNTNKTSCPLNPTAKNPNHTKHPLAISKNTQQNRQHKTTQQTTQQKRQQTQNIQTPTKQPSTTFQQTMNPYVMHNLTKYLPASDIQNLRSTNKTMKQKVQSGISRQAKQRVALWGYSSQI